MRSTDNKTTTSSQAQKSTPTRGSFFHEGEEGQSFFQYGDTIQREAFFEPTEEADVQAKLKIGPVNDAFENEADQVADQVVQRMADPVADTTPATDISPQAEEEELQREEESTEELVQAKAIGIGEEDIRRKCSACEQEGGMIRRMPIEEETSPKVQAKCEACSMKDHAVQLMRISRRATSSDGGTSVPSGFSQKLNASKGGGSPLGTTTRSKMEGAFGGQDFSSVRIHTGSQATELSNSIQAKAFTHGNDIYFNRGQFDPNSRNGQHLIAHELTHTVQQGGGVRRKETGPEPVFSPSKKVLEAGEEGRAVERYGIVHMDEGTNLWAMPDRSKSKLALLPLNTKVFVDRKLSNGWYAVYVEQHQSGGTVPVKKGTFGYVAANRITLDLPDPNAYLYRVTEDGIGALALARKLYQNKFQASWGNDFRFLVNVLVMVNHNRGRKYIYKESQQDGWDKAKVKKGQIWVPGLQLIAALKDVIPSGSISYETYKTIRDVAIGVGAFVVGLLHGALMSVLDVFIGIKDLAVLAWKIIKSLFQGTLLIDTIKFFNDISKIKWEDIKAILDQKWNHPDIWARWKFRGYVIGYAIVEILMLVFSGGILTAVKWIGKVGKAGKFAKWLASLPKISKMLQKANSLGGEAVEKLRKAMKAGVQLTKVHIWAAEKLKMPLAVLRRLTKLDIEKLKKLPQWARERFSQLTEKAMLRLLGCNSPCKVNVHEIQAALKLVGKGGKLLKTPADVIASLPKGLNKTKISRKLRRKDGSALMKAIKEAKLTDKDFEKIVDFLTPGDANPAQGYRTFTRYLTGVIPAKNGADITELNKILAAMIKAEPRRGAALKGAMFEQWIALHVPQLASKTLSRKAFDLRKLIGKVLPPYRRTVDTWDPAKLAIWEMKHQLSKVPDKQALDYLKLMQKTTSKGERIVKEVNYIFPTQTAADLNKHLVTTYKFTVYYNDDMTNALVKLKP